MGKRAKASDRWTRPTPENQAGQVNGQGRPLRVFFLTDSAPDRDPVGRLGEGSD